MPSPDEHRAKRPKTTLACDVCRHRKSRCDGARPKCSYCLNAGLDCIYRGPPTLDPTLGEFDAVTIMTRLARVEAIAIKAASERHSQDAFTPDERHSNTNSCRSYHTLPDLHTGANHKVLQYWSRLRVRLNPCGVAVLRFLREAEQSIPSPLHHELPVSSVNDAEEALQWLSKHRQRLPLSLSVLLLSADIFDIDSVAVRIAALQGPHYWQRLELRDLLVCSLAFSTLPPSDGNGWDGPAAASSMQAASAHLSLAMQGLSTVFVEDEDVAVALLLGLAGILLHCFGRPYLSLSLLQAAESALRRLLDSVVDRPFDNTTVSTYERLFYLLQGYAPGSHLSISPAVAYQIHALFRDVLSEVDGRPSRLSPSPPCPLRGHIDSSAPVSTTPPEWPGNDRQKDMSEPDSNVPVRSTSKIPDFDTYLPANLWLRSCTNHILNQLYIPSQAYCRPAETADLISQINSNLQAWYHTLPVGIRFSRDLRTLRASRSAMSLRQRELAIRYHNCIFLLNRPILYYVLYQDFEHSRPPSPVGESADGGHDMWALESCHGCIDAATMIICILNHCFNHEVGPGAIPPTWVEVQMLLGAYAILLSVHATPSRCQTLRDPAELAQLLDLAESVMTKLFNRSEVFRDILKIMLNMRQGFQNESPSSGMIGWLGIGAGV